MKFKDEFENEENLHFETDTYEDNNNLAIIAICEDGAPYCTVSVNIARLPHPYFCYDMNNNGGELYRKLIKEGYMEEARVNGHSMMFSGFCIYPICKWLGTMEEER